MERGHGFRIRRGGQNDLGSAEFLKLFAATNGGDFVAEFVSELNAQVAEACDSLDGYKITRLRAAVAE